MSRHRHHVSQQWRRQRRSGERKGASGGGHGGQGSGKAGGDGALSLASGLVAEVALRVVARQAQLSKGYNSEKKNIYLTLDVTSAASKDSSVAGANLTAPVAPALRQPVRRHGGRRCAAPQGPPPPNMYTPWPGQGPYSQAGCTLHTASRDRRQVERGAFSRRQCDDARPRRVPSSRAGVCHEERMAGERRAVTLPHGRASADRDRIW